jgi:hypothetical protein
MKTKNNKRRSGVSVKLTSKEAGYLSSLVEAQVSRLLVLPNKERAKQPFKEEYQAFSRLGTKLSFS